MPDRRDERSATDKWNRRSDRIHAQSVFSNRPYPTSLRVFIGAARVADILRSEGKTMNGSAQKRKPSIVLHGVGVQAGASACRRRAGRRSRREAAVAAHWRRGPAAGEATNSFFVRHETGTLRAAHLETATRAPCSVTLTTTVDAAAIHSRRRVDTDAVRLPACAIQAPELHRTQAHRPRWSVEGRKGPHCSRRIRFIRFDWRMMNLHTHDTGSRLRSGRFLESVLADPQVELRPRQPKPPRGFRFVSSAVLQDLGNRGAFDDAQISRVAAE
jgi:hypothetical protein